MLSSTLVLFQNRIIICRGFLGIQCENDWPRCGWFDSEKKQTPITFEIGVCFLEMVSKYYGILQVNGPVMFCRNKSETSAAEAQSFA